MNSLDPVRNAAFLRLQEVTPKEKKTLEWTMEEAVRIAKGNNDEEGELPKHGRTTGVTSLAALAITKEEGRTERSTLTKMEYLFKKNGARFFQDSDGNRKQCRFVRGCSDEGCLFAHEGRSLIPFPFESGRQEGGTKDGKALRKIKVQDIKG